MLFWADNAQHKRKLLDHWLRDTTINQAIVFASTQVECDGLANDLQQEGFSAVALHGALSQGLRNRRLMALRSGQVQVLVATDVAARGIDVPTITHVFNYGLPMKAEDYTHRIGRTGRAGRDGLAVTFAEFRDRRKIFDIEGYSKQQFKSEVVPGLEPQQRAPQARPEFGGRSRPGGFESRDGFSRDRKPAGAGRGGFGGGFAGNDRSGFGGRGAPAPVLPPVVTKALVVMPLRVMTVALVAVPAAMATAMAASRALATLPVAMALVVAAMKVALHAVTLPLGVISLPVVSSLPASQLLPSPELAAASLSCRTMHASAPRVLLADLPADCCI